ncbi:conserved hypothetical protein [Thermosulfidibacter takaii ABI70S6]|uniref:UPF0316 protein TST_1180 n=1 Tax=Thermosulfidibacter takaii (strain DSM 17441 / JCM 13301 / NBRC 103674 / ABI70S6) TaxID=1298851 RepID=A0A0S3QUH5_THET7|nr:DUF2179 domain-containing protein [Thermosulfidibacter takaii]BAT71972.1 conserved hypothetical protein [Thermosulfidibacter takaii ABI70S6]
MKVLIGCLLIFFARIVDVSLGTIRIMMVSKGKRKEAAFIGFFEVLIWAVVVAHIIQNLSKPIYFVAYAAGFSAGIWTGMKIEEKLAIGNVLVRVITRLKADELEKKLRDNNFIVTSVDAHGKYGPVKVIFGIIDRKEVPRFLAIVRKCNPNAFYTIEEVKEVRQRLETTGKKPLFGVLKKK